MQEWIFFVSLFGFLLSSAVLWRVPRYTSDDFEVLFTLFVFLSLIKSLEKSGFLSFIASFFEKGKYPALKLVFLTAFLSMFITNDVSLMVVLPLTLAMKLPDVEKVVILEAIASNGGSSLSPFGNPQNIFIYFHYDVHFLDFIKEIFPLFAVSMFLLLVFTPKYPAVKPSLGKSSFDKKGYIYAFLFIVFVIAVLGFLPLWIGFLLLVFLFFSNKEFLKIDYFLIGTFFFFFGFTDNIDYAFSIHFHNPFEVFIYSAFLSQIISNVPATLFLADFTNHWKDLLWGVSVGGFGNIIGSLANLIAFRMYARRYRQTGKFLLKFHIFGYIFFLAGIGVYILYRSF